MLLRRNRATSAVLRKNLPDKAHFVWTSPQLLSQVRFLSFDRPLVSQAPRSHAQYSLSLDEQLGIATTSSIVVGKRPFPHGLITSSSSTFTRRPNNMSHSDSTVAAATFSTSNLTSNSVLNVPAATGGVAAIPGNADFVYQEINKRRVVSSNSTRDALLNQPTGPYTVMRTDGNGTHIFRFSQHVERMAASVAALVAQVAGAPPTPAPPPPHTSLTSAPSSASSSASSASSFSSTGSNGHGGAYHSSSDSSPAAHRAHNRAGSTSEAEALAPSQSPSSSSIASPSPSSSLPSPSNSTTSPSHNTAMPGGAGKEDPLALFIRESRSELQPLLQLCRPPAMRTFMLEHIFHAVQGYHQEMARRGAIANGTASTTASGASSTGVGVSSPSSSSSSPSPSSSSSTMSASSQSPLPAINGELRILVLVAIRDPDADETENAAQNGTDASSLDCNGASHSGSAGDDAEDIYQGLFDVVVHVAPLPPVPRDPVNVSVCQAHRSNATVKDSSWVQSAKVYEDAKLKDENEVVMVSKGKFLEGLSSNFFALVKLPEPEGANDVANTSNASVSSGGEHKGGEGRESRENSMIDSTNINGTNASSSSSSSVVSAPPRVALCTARDGVLIGTVRQLVLDVCAQMGIPVIEEAPHISTIKSWIGCAVSSTSRMLLPINELRFRETDVQPVIPSSLLTTSTSSTSSSSSSSSSSSLSSSSLSSESGSSNSMDVASTRRREPIYVHTDKGIMITFPNDPSNLMTVLAANVRTHFSAQSEPIVMPKPVQAKRLHMKPSM